MGEVHVLGEWRVLENPGELLDAHVEIHVIHANSVLCNAQTAAVVRGGNVPWQQATVGPWCFKVGADGNLHAGFTRDTQAVMLPANQAIQLVTSGAFGLLYYREASSSGPVRPVRYLMLY